MSSSRGHEFTRAACNTSTEQKDRPFQNTGLYKKKWLKTIGKYKGAIYKTEGI